MSTFGSYGSAITPLDIERQVRRLRAKSSFTPDDVTAVARRIHDWLPPQGSFFDSLSLYGKAMDWVMCSAAQDADLFVAASNVLTGLTWLYAQSMPYEPDAPVMLREYADQFMQAASSEPEPAVRAGHLRSAEHLMRLNATYSRRLNMVRAVQERLPYTQEWIDALGLTATELDAYSAYVAYQIAECRRYGVKPCVMQDGIMHLAEDTWVFLDGFDEFGKLRSDYLEGLRTPLAITHLADRKSVRSLESQTFQEGKMGGLSPSYDRYMTVSVQLDGTLTIDSELGLYPLERIFEEAGRADIFAVFRLVHLMRLSDLIVPEIVRQRHQAPDWPSSPRNKSAYRAHVEALPGRLRQLVIPRVRLLEDVDAIQQAQEGELAEDMDFSEGLQGSEQRILGPMVGHFRRLPAGYSASPEACSLALEQRGMLPPEGMTYVKRRDGDTVIHVARRR